MQRDGVWGGLEHRRAASGAKGGAAASGAGLAGVGGDGSRAETGRGGGAQEEQLAPFPRARERACTGKEHARLCRGWESVCAPVQGTSERARLCTGKENVCACARDERARAPVHGKRERGRACKGMLLGREKLGEERGLWCFGGFRCLRR